MNDRRSLIRNTMFNRNKSSLSESVLNASAAKAEPSVETLENLENVVERINGRIHEVKSHKRFILKDMLYIYQNRELYFKDKPEYLENFALFIEQNIYQERATTLDDFKIIRLITENGIEGILDQDISDMVYILKRIAQLSSLKNLHGIQPDMLQKKLLSLLENRQLDRKLLKQEILNNLEKKRSSYNRHENFPGYRTKLNRTRGELNIKIQDKDVLEKIHDILKGLNADNLDQVLRMISSS
ncbi:MAG: hypothetical protein HQM12_17875 [SAR324 cluster bacterium]|nr:hypothetical protein [SAR324 cluster bacterium]